MKTVVPSYYDAFQCIADRCHHSCCVGWEIDIDPDTAAFYRTVTGSFGERLRDSVNDTADGCSFCLDEQERCPFLNKHGLCDIYITLGEEALCEICSLHPRFRNDFSDRTEWGLGLCCEAAAELILTWPDPVTWNDHDLPLPDDPEEAALITFRSQALAIAKDRTRSLCEREDALLQTVGAAVPRDRRTLYGWFSPLERLDPSWDLALDTLCTDRNAAWQVPDTVVEQCLVYFLYRQLPPALEDGQLDARLALAVLSTRLLCTLTAAADGKTETFLELARLYSSEIEYSDENIARLLSRLRRYAAS